MEKESTDELKKLVKKKKKNTVHNAAPNLARLTAMIGVSYKPDDKFAPFECRSLNENKILKVMDSMGRQNMLRHHTSNITRVYPKGNRFDSSNYNPIPGFAAGA